MEKLKGLFRLLRFELPFSAGICVVFGQLLALGEFASLTLTAIGFFSVFFVSASILVLNDFFDVETDKINAPHRPIPSKMVTSNEALFFSIFLLIAGLFLSSLISISTLIISTSLAFIGFLYNQVFKKYGILGNLMVSFCVGMTFVYGGVSVSQPNNEAVWFFALIAALVDLGEEIAADSMDVKGDLLINSNSIAITYSRTTALKVSGTIFFIVISLSVVPFILNWFAPIYFIPIAIMDLSIAYPALKLLKSKKDDEGRKYIRWIYLGATLGLIIFLVMKVLGA